MVIYLNRWLETFIWKTFCDAWPSKYSASGAKHNFSRSQSCKTIKRKVGENLKVSIISLISSQLHIIIKFLFLCITICSLLNTCVSMIRDSLMNLRKKLCQKTTTMNFQGNAVLRKLLPGLELSHGGLSSEHRLPNAEHLSELQRIVTSHKVSEGHFCILVTLQNFN